MSAQSSLSFKNLKKLASNQGQQQDHQHIYELQQQQQQQQDKSIIQISDYADFDKSRTNICFTESQQEKQKLVFPPVVQTGDANKKHHLNHNSATETSFHLLNNKIERQKQEQQYVCQIGGDKIACQQQHISQKSIDSLSNISKAFQQLSAQKSQRGAENAVDNTETLHSILVKSTQWSNRKEKQVKELAQEQIKKGLILGFELTSQGVAIANSKDIPTTQQPSHNTTQRITANGSNSNRKNRLIESRQQQNQQIIDLLLNSKQKTEGNNEGTFIDAMANCFSDKSLESLRSGSHTMKKQDSANKLIKELYEEDKKVLYQQQLLDYQSTFHNSLTTNTQQDPRMVGIAKMEYRIRQQAARSKSSQRKMLAQIHQQKVEGEINKQQVKHLRKQDQLSPKIVTRQVTSQYGQRKMKEIGSDNKTLQFQIQSQINQFEEDGGLSEIQKITQIGKECQQNLSNQRQPNLNQRIKMTCPQVTTLQSMTNANNGNIFALNGIAPELRRQQTTVKCQYQRQKSVASNSVGASGQITHQSTIGPQLHQNSKQSSSLFRKPPTQRQSKRNCVNSLGYQGDIFLGLSELRIHGVKPKLLNDLYEAKCEDLLLKCQKEQEKRFLEFCQKTIKNRQIIMRECGLGIASAKVIGQIIAGDFFSHLDLAKNNLGNEGLEVLLKGLKVNCSLIHLDVASNDINYEGAQKLFKSIESHPTLTSLVMANHDRLHRNRMGPKACCELRNLLTNNKILSMVNISDNGIGNEGLKILSTALTGESSLVSLNLSNNDLNGSTAMNYLSNFLRNSKTIQELNLSSNIKLGDQFVIELSQIMQENSNKLMKLDLQNIGATSNGVGALFFALRNNQYLSHLALNQNDLSGQKIDQISICLWNNRKLSHLMMRECKMTSEGANAIAEGLIKNQAMKHLDLAFNKLKAESLEKWPEVLGKSQIIHLDLSFNDLDDQGVLYILKGLQNVPQPEISEGTSLRQDPKLEVLNLKGVHMKDVGAIALSQFMVSNQRIIKINTDSNTMNHKYVEEIQAACARNRNLQKKTALPKFKEELVQLKERTKDSGGLKQRNDCMNQAMKLMKERALEEKEIYEDEELIDEFRDAEKQMLKQFKTHKDKNEDILEALDNQIAILEKKIVNKESYIQDQLDNIDRRMSYIKSKSDKVQKEVDGEKEKINKEKSKYDSLVKDLEVQLEECLKEQRMAAVLQKTYVDEIEREKKKYETMLKTQQQQHLNKDEKMIGHEKEIACALHYYHHSHKQNKQENGGGEKQSLCKKKKSKSKKPKKLKEKKMSSGNNDIAGGNNLKQCDIKKQTLGLKGSIPENINKYSSNKSENNQQLYHQYNELKSPKNIVVAEPNCSN